MNENEHLFKEFPSISTEEWEQVIKKDLGRTDYKQKLKWDTGEGVDALPFYRKEDRGHLDKPLKQSGYRWKIRQRIYEHDINEANKSAQKSVEGGAEAVEIQTKISSIAGAIGLEMVGTAIQSQNDFSRLLKDISLTETGLHFNTGMLSPIFVAMLANECEKQEVDATKVHGSFLYDPFSFILTHGRMPGDEEQITDSARQLVGFCTEKLPNILPLGVDARIYHNAGAAIVQELGFAMAAGSEYLAAIPGHSIDTEAVASAIHFKFSIGSNYFLEIAKFRAARKLWAAILEAYNIDDAKMVIHGETSYWNKTKMEPYSNMLRTTTESMSAAVGGCDSITVEPFDAAFRQPDDFSQRIARNSQLILKEEAYMDKVSDPAAGSWYIETLTDKIAEAAWSVFQEVEQQGGLMKAIQTGFIQTAIAESRKEKNKAIAGGDRIFVGVNKYETDEHSKEITPENRESTVSMEQTKNGIEIDTHNLIPFIKKVLNHGAAIGDIAPALFDMSSVQFEPLQAYRAEEIINERNTDDAD